MPAAIARTGSDLTRARALPGRNEVAYWAQPWQQHEQSAARFITAVVDQMEHGEWLVADATAAGALLAAGVVSMIAMQAGINMGVTPGLLPTTGLPLPFISAGGSALIVNLAMVGLLLNVAQQASEPEPKGRRLAAARA